MSSLVGSWVDVPCENRAHAPSSRYHSACAVYKDCLYVFGGRSGSTLLNDLHGFNFARKLWRFVRGKGNVPSARYAHTCVIYKDALYVFGGYDGRSRLNDLMEFNILTQQWGAVGANAGSAPRPRYRHSAVVYGNSMYVFGGDSNRNLSDFHEFNFETRTWSPVHATGTPPPPRCSASLVVFGGTAVLFGGYGGSGNINDLHMFDFDRRMWSTIVTEGPAPSPRNGHVAVVHSNAMYVFGGYANTTTNDFHKLSFDSSKKHTWQTVPSEGTPPRACYYHTAAVYLEFFLVKSKPSKNETDEVAKLRSEVTQLRNELQDNRKINELRNELNQLRTELREDAKTLRGAVLQESTKLVKRLMAETVTQLADLQGQAGVERSPLVRPVDPHLVELCSCPISMDIMKDPVLTPSGVTYERAMIEQHLDRVGAFDPTTNVPLTKAELYPNRAIKDLVEKHFPNHAR